MRKFFPTVNFLVIRYKAPFGLHFELQHITKKFTVGIFLAKFLFYLMKNNNLIGVLLKTD
jgi:hypothetical protein